MYIRKTVDIWEVHGLYCGTWEHETTETTFQDGKRALKEYRENMPEYAHKLIKKREKKEGTK